MEDQRSTWWERFLKGDLYTAANLTGCTDIIRFQILYELRCSVDIDKSLRARDALEIEIGLSVKQKLSLEEIESELDAQISVLFEDSKVGADVRRGFMKRRERDMIDQRRIDRETFLRVYNEEPSTNILWGYYQVDNLISAFRIDEEQTFMDIDDNPIEIDTKYKVGVVHPLEMPEAQRNRWNVIFADYRIRGFDQIERRIQHQYGPVVAPFLIEFEGVPSMVSLGVDGWKGKDVTENDANLRRRFNWAGHLEVCELAFYNDSIQVRFKDLETGGDKEIRSANPVVLFEVIHSVQQAMSAQDKS